jgi:DNA-binding SARP family transcriptional activator
MYSSLFSEQAPLTVGLEDSTLVSLLERGLQCARQERYEEGATFFVLARERLSPNQVHISASLNALIEISTGYWQAQQALHEASKRFAEADSAQQAQLAALEKLLPTLMENISTIDQPFTNSKGHQQLQTLRTPIANSTGHQSPAEAQLLPEAGSALPALYFTCFGRFEVRRLGQPILLCSSRSGQSILRYLAVQPGHSATFDALMAILWPEDGLEVAQPKLHSAISALRHSLNQGYKCNPGSGYIVCKNRVYSLNPAVVIQTDVDDFLQYYEVERQTSDERIALYEKACSLYTSPFLPEDLYADWSFLQREHLNRVYLSMCRVLSDHYLKTKCYEDAAKWATSILKVNRCEEEAHRQLIQVYAAQGRRLEAIQQYQRCETLLREELGVTPLPETTHVFQKLLISETSSADTAKIQ